MSDPHKVRVFVPSDVRVYREGISRLIATADSLELAGAAATGDSAARLRGARPDVVLVDAIERVDLVLVREIGSAGGGAPGGVLVAPGRGGLFCWGGAGGVGFFSLEGSPGQPLARPERASRGERSCFA